MSYALYSVALPANPSCVRLHIPGVTQGVRFLHNLSCHRHPVSTYSASFDLWAESQWQVTSFPTSVIAQADGQSLMPGLSQVVMGRVSKRPLLILCLLALAYQHTLASF